jgi:hypothetical protein
VKKFKVAKPIYLAMASLVFMLLNDFNLVNITPEKWDSYVSIIAVILIGFGVMANPMVEIPVEEAAEENIAE